MAADPVFPAYDATYAFTHLQRTLQAQTPVGQKFDATTATAKVLTQVAAGGTVPVTVASATLAPSKAPTPVHTFQVEQQKGKDSKR